MARGHSYQRGAQFALRLDHEQFVLHKDKAPQCLTFSDQCSCDVSIYRIVVCGVTKRKCQQEHVTVFHAIVQEKSLLEGAMANFRGDFECCRGHLARMSSFPR